MSTGNPETPAQAPDGDAAGPAGKSIAIGAVLALVLGVVGFFVGSSVKASDYEKGKSGYEKIYAEGYSAGQAAGNAAGQQAGQAKGVKLGTAQGLQTGRKAGELIGEKEGEKKGEQVGYANGYKEGFAAGVGKGSQAALGGLSNWENNVPYIVELDPSPVSGVAQQVYSRTLMKADTSYFLCPGGNAACSQPLVK